MLTIKKPQEQGNHMRYHLVINGKSTEYNSEADVAQRMESLRSNSIAQVNVEMDDTSMKISLIADPQDCLMN
jgi:hypothetical protein